jgi:hypothetical protein
VRLALAPAVWLAHFTAVYALASVACERVPAGVAAASALALGFYLAFGLLDYRRLRARRGDGEQAFVARVNVLLCALAALATLWVAYPAFVLPACAS